MNTTKGMKCAYIVVTTRTYYTLRMLHIFLFYAYSVVSLYL